MKQAPIFRLSSHLHFIFSISLIPLLLFMLKCFRDLTYTVRNAAYVFTHSSTISIMILRKRRRMTKCSFNIYTEWLLNLICHKTKWQCINIPDGGKDNARNEDIAIYLRPFCKKKLWEVWEVFCCNVRHRWSVSLFCCIIIHVNINDAPCQSRSPKLSTGV